MQHDNMYMSELFRIIVGALRLDTNKVRNYASFLADKLEENGDKSSAERLRKLLTENDHQLHPANLSTKNPPVDSETRFPLLEIVNLDDPSETPLIITDDQRDVLNEFISVAKSQTQFEAKGISTPLSLLLFGPPGSGKSRLAREIARELGLKLYVARLDGLISSYLGSTSKNIRAIFEFASSTPCALLLDEFDAIAKLRDDKQELGELKRVVNSFLQNLDSLGTQSIVIAATNHHQLLDSAVWRRFSYRINLQNPNSELRRKMWQDFSKPTNWSNHDIAILADLADGFSGADIKEVGLRLKRYSILTKRKPTLKDAFIGLQRLSSGDGENGRFLSKLKTEDNHQIVFTLKQRNKKLYSHSILAALLGVSRATAYRWTIKGGLNNARSAKRRPRK